MDTKLILLGLAISLVIPLVFATTTMIHPVPGENLTFGNFSILIDTTVLEPKTVDCWLSAPDVTPAQLISDRSSFIDGYYSFDLTIDTQGMQNSYYYNLSCMLDNDPQERFEVYPLFIYDCTLNPDGCTILPPTDMFMSNAIATMSASVKNGELTTKVIVNTPISVDCSLKNNCKSIYKQALKDYLNSLTIK